MVTLIIQNQLRFSFGEFVRFIVNGSVEFANDKYVINHKGLSYHWAPFWKECNVCSKLTMPHFVIQLETLKEDLTLLINKIQGGGANDEEISIVKSFPHTHNADKDSHTPLVKQTNKDRLKKYFSTLTTRDIEELYEKYKLDHILFGYTLKEFLQYTLN